MDIRLAPLVMLLDLNTRLFENCLEGLDDDAAHVRVTGQSNHVAFIAAHLADSRFFALKLLGGTLENPLAPSLANARTLDEVTAPLPLAVTRRAWRSVSAALREALAGLTAEQLDAPSATRFPVADRTMLGTLAFLTQHDSYHVGQLSLLRRQLGLPGMSYR